MILLRAVFLAALLPLTSCASDDRAAEHEFLARYDQVHRAELAHFESAQAAFPSSFDVPSERVFEDLGTLIVTDRQLLGRPGKAFVRVYFTYVNTTGRPLASLNATLYVHGPESDESWGERLLMRLPFRYALTPDSTYTSWLDTPTKGVETQPGWAWDLVLEPAETDAE